MTNAWLKVLKFELVNFICINSIEVKLSPSLII